jgi:hypothetical protein
MTPVDLDGDRESLAFQITNSIESNSGIGSAGMNWDFDPESGEGSIGVYRGPINQPVGTIRACPVCLEGVGAGGENV